MTTLVQATAGARRLAQSAALRNTGLGSCPYPVDGTGADNAARAAWVREYRRHRPTAITVDYSGDLDALADGDEPGPGGLVDGLTLDDRAGIGT